MKPYPHPSILLSTLEMLWQFPPPKIEGHVEIACADKKVLPALTPKDNNQRWYMTPGRVRVDLFSCDIQHRTLLAQYDKKEWYSLSILTKEYQILPYRPMKFDFQVTKKSEHFEGAPATRITAISESLAPIVFCVETWVDQENVPLLIEYDLWKGCNKSEGFLIESRQWRTVLIEEHQHPPGFFDIPPDFGPPGTSGKPIYNVGDLMKNTAIQRGKIGA
jgi:hypothetical protein